MIQREIQECMRLIAKLQLEFVNTILEIFFISSTTIKQLCYCKKSISYQFNKITGYTIISKSTIFHVI